MSGTGHLSELESLRSQVADLQRELVERDRHLDRNLQDQPEQAGLLRTIVEGTAADTGEEFFRSLVRHLARALNVRYAFVGEWREQAFARVRTLAVWSGTDFLEPFEYDPRNTPCATVIGQQFCLHKSGVQRLFPEDHLLVQLEVDSYCGMPLFDKSGKPLGLLVVMDDRPITRAPLVKDLLQIFGMRAAAELQRQQDDETLRESERCLRLTQFALDHAQDSVLWADDSKRFVYANEAACRSLGYSKEELLSLSIPDIVPRHDPARFQQRLEEIRQGGAATFESLHRRKDGTEFPVETSITYLEPEGESYTCSINRDITERKQIEKLFRVSEERWQLAVGGSNDGIWDWNIQTGDIFFSLRWKTMRGFEDHEIKHHVDEWRSRIHPDDLDRVLQNLDAYLAKQTPEYREEYRVRRKDGSYMWVLDQGKALWAEDGTPLRMVGSECDINVRKQFAARDASRVRQLKKLYELSMTLSGDPGIILKEVVHSIGEVFEVRVVCLSEIVGQELYFRAVYVDGQIFTDAGHCSLAITPCATVEQTKDLRIFDRIMERFPEASFLKDHQAFSYCGFPVLDNEGRVVAVTCLLDNKPHEFSKEEQDLLRIFGQRIAAEIERNRHVVEQERAADELRRSYDFIRQIIDADPNFIFVKDRAGQFILVNKAVADTYGTTVENLLGKTDADFNANQEEVEFFRQKDLEVMDSLHERFIVEEVITDSTGKTRWLQTVKRPILDDQGRAIMVLGASTDITDRKHMEESLREREQDLCAAIEERARISQDLHDGILQSLFAVGLGLEASKSVMSPRTRKRSGPPLDQAIDQLNRVMHEIRNFIAGLGSNLLKGRDLPTALQHMLDSLTQHQAMRVHLAIEDRAAQAVSVDQSLHLLLIIQEAVSNCIRHGRAQEATVSLKMLKHGVRLSIRDNGRGFNPEAAKGTGRGLSNMAARARQIGGRFTVLSKVNEGTRIVFDLPKEASHGCH